MCQRHETNKPAKLTGKLVRRYPIIAKAQSKTQSTKAGGHAKQQNADSAIWQIETPLHACSPQSDKDNQKFRKRIMLRHKIYSAGCEVGDDFKIPAARLMSRDVWRDPSWLQPGGAMT